MNLYKFLFFLDFLPMFSFKLSQYCTYRFQNLREKNNNKKRKNGSIGHQCSHFQLK
jgi:hypothetical protein